MFRLSLLISAAALAAWACFGQGLPPQPSRPQQPGQQPPEMKIKDDVDAQTVACRIRCEIAVVPPLDWITLVAEVPKSIPGKQEISGLAIEPKPERIFEKDGVKYMSYTFSKPKKNIEITVDFNATLTRFDYSVASKKEGAPPTLSAADRKKFTASEKKMEKDAPEVKAVAEKIEGKTDAEIIRNVMAWERANLTYFINQGDKGAIGGITAKGGDCSEFSDIFVALCRAKGVPARSWHGVIARNVVPGGSTNWHRRVEAFLDGIGWVPFDPTHAASGGATFERMRPAYVYLGNIRNDPTLNGSNGRYVHWKGKGTARVTYDFTVGNR